VRLVFRKDMAWNL